jgi:hypothetical protein
VIASVAEQAFTTLTGEGVAAGEPTAVHTPEGELSYWLVPGSLERRLVAVARVLADGRLATVAELRRPAADVAEAVTGLNEAAAANTAAELTHADGHVFGPMLVHDGPVGREAWLLVITHENGSRRWVFTTSGGTYERPADTPPPPQAA